MPANASSDKASGLERRTVVRMLLADRGDLLVVAGLGAPAWDATDAGDHPLTFPLWGGMGGATAIGLGLALAQPDRRVLVLTGDGELLMGLGSLATVACSVRAILRLSCSTTSTTAKPACSPRIRRSASISPPPQGLAVSLRRP